MAVTLSNGVTLEPTGQTDSRGFPVYMDGAGTLYTNQNGKFIISSQGGFNLSGFSDYLDQLGLGEYKPELISTQQGITGFTLPSDVYQPKLSGDFENQATEEIGAYYDKEMANLEKSISIAKKQAEDTKKLSEESQAQTEKRTYATEDRNFADALDAMQKGFAGRGTYTSGFRQGALDKQDTQRETALDATRQEFGDATKSRNLTFSQFLENKDFQQETSSLDIKRSRNEAIAAREEQLRAQEEAKRKSAIEAANEGFSRFLTSGGTA